MDITPQQPNPGDLEPPYHEPRISQRAMNLARDESGDGRTIGALSYTESTAYSVRSFESMRDIHEFIREFNGRSYNAQNYIYFLPAGQFKSESLILQRYLSPSTSHSRPFPLMQIKLSTAACACPIPLPGFYSLRDFRSGISNIFATAFVKATCTHNLTWLTLSYDLNLVSRRRFSI